MQIQQTKESRAHRKSDNSFAKELYGAMIVIHSGNKKSKTIIIIIFGMMCSGILIISLSKSDYAELKARIGNGDFRIEVADTVEKLKKGLSGRRKLDENCGMLFIFPEEGQLSFWMKDTEFPITIAFLSANGTIQELYDMEAFSNKVITSRGTYKYAIELNKGALEKSNSWFGTSVELIDYPRNYPFLFK